MRVYMQCMDMSENKFDDAPSVALASYSSTPSCGLTTLVLTHCDIADNEIPGFAKPLCANKAYHILDLIRNLIGAKEVLTIVQPDLTTEGSVVTSKNHDEPETELELFAPQQHRRARHRARPQQ
ncbi:unnamed protein product, partial [Aphanomyces euteiches]